MSDCEDTDDCAPLDIPRQTREVARALAGADGHDPEAWRIRRDIVLRPVWLDYVPAAAAAIRALDA